MPDIETLMQEWPPEFEELLKEVRQCFIYIIRETAQWVHHEVSIPLPITL